MAKALVAKIAALVFSAVCGAAQAAQIVQSFPFSMSVTTFFAHDEAFRSFEFKRADQLAAELALEGGLQNVRLFIDGTLRAEIFEARSLFSVAPSPASASLAIVSAPRTRGGRA